MNHVKSLGVTLDDQLKLSKHVSNVTRSFFYHIRLLKHMHRYLDFQSAATLVHSFVTSRVDYCNWLPAATPVKQMDQLHSSQCSRPLAASCSSLRLQSTRENQRSASLAVYAGTSDIQAVYRGVHWLALGYLNEQCVPVRTDAYWRNLRSADKTELKVPRHKLSTYGPQAFGIAGPTEWNSLRYHLHDKKLTLEQFTRGFKTQLSSVSYNL